MIFYAFTYIKAQEAESALKMAEEGAPSLPTLVEKEEPQEAAPPADQTEEQKEVRLRSSEKPNTLHVVLTKLVI